MRLRLSLRPMPMSRTKATCRQGHLGPPIILFYCFLSVFHDYSLGPSAWNMQKLAALFAPSLVSLAEVC